MCQPCPQNSFWNGQECKCLNGFIKVGDKCQKCKEHEVLKQGVCVCKDTFTKFSGICICPLNSQLKNEKCVCNPGSEMKNNQCVAITPNCPDHSSWDGTECKCNNGYEKKNTVCVKIPTDPSKNCPPKSAWSGSACVCITGLHMINGNCQKCQDNGTYDPASQRCTCNPGYYGDFTECFSCDSSCKTCWGGAKDRCITCPRFYKVKDGACVCKNKNRC